MEDNDGGIYHARMTQHEYPHFFVQAANAMDQEESNPSSPMINYNGATIEGPIRSFPTTGINCRNLCSVRHQLPRRTEARHRTAKSPNATIPEQHETGGCIGIVATASSDVWDGLTGLASSSMFGLLSLRRKTHGDQYYTSQHHLDLVRGGYNMILVRD